MDMQRRVWEQNARSEGIKEGKLQMTMQLIKSGISIEEVADMADIPVSELEVAIRKTGMNNASGILNKYANPSLISSEREVFEDVLVERHI